MTIDKEFEAGTANHPPPSAMLDEFESYCSNYDFSKERKCHYWFIWQAARAIDAKRIAELEAQNKAMLEAIEATNKAVKMIVIDDRYHQARGNLDEVYETLGNAANLCRAAIAKVKG